MVEIAEFCTSIVTGFFDDACPVEAEPPLWTAEILFPGGLQPIRRSVQL